MEADEGRRCGETPEPKYDSVPLATRPSGALPLIGASRTGGVCSTARARFPSRRSRGEAWWDAARAGDCRTAAAARLEDSERQRGTRAIRALVAEPSVPFLASLMRDDRSMRWMRGRRV